jgi:hypothetical protein
MVENACVTALLGLLAELRRKFPGLEVRLESEPAQVDLNIDIPQQPALPFAVNMNVQEDELHVSAGRFWWSGSPGYDPVTLEWYRDVVVGVLTGTYRVVEYQGWLSLCTELQRSEGGAWKTIARKYRFPWLGRRATTVLQAPRNADAV